MASSFVQSIELDEVSSGLYQCRFNAETNGSPILGDIIAYGGTTLAMAVKAAHYTVKDSYNIFSATGNFLSPALTTSPLRFRVVALRDTRTFATRSVTVLQQRDGELTDRTVLHMTADFHIKGDRSMLEYGPDLAVSHSSWENSYTLDQVKGHAAKRLGGKVPEFLEQVFDSSFHSTRKYFETRISSECITAQTLGGFFADLPTTSDGTHITKKQQVNWFKPAHKVDSPADHAAAVAYIMDAGSSAWPPVAARRELSDIAAANSLDFALRYFTSDLDLNKVHLREENTVRAREGRTYSEARLWTDQGNLIANMSQQCILRPKEDVGISKL